MNDEADGRDRFQPLERLHPNERVKAESDYLRGTIREGLADPITGAIAEDDTKLLKFHGSYQQDDRDLRDERRRQKLEPAYEFMIRLRLPAGVCTPEQWLALDELANHYANRTLRLTTRQTFQLHGVLKRDLKRVMQGINALMLDTRGACGDITRTVMAAANPHQSAVHGRLHELARAISDHLAPRTRGYYEVWLDEERVAVGPDDEAQEEEPIYGPTYLPRKFKIGLAVPPTNDIDVFSQDIGFIAVTDEQGELAGFNVAAGGGMGRTDNEPKTYPRLGTLLGFCRPEQVLDVAEQIVTTQRDHGDRVDRSQARLKYTIDRMGVEAFKAEVERRLGFAFEAARDVRFTHNGDRYGWVEGADGRWHYTLFIENGRVRDRDDYALMTGLREIARAHRGTFRLTGNQNLIIAEVPAEERATIEDLMESHGLRHPDHYSPLRRHSIACVAMPTCGLAMAEAERYLPSLVTKLEAVMEEAGIAEQPITIRMSGCNNGCSRPYLAEIGFSGRGPGKYNLYLGGGFAGERLNKPYLENVGEARILEALTPILHHYADERRDGEPFGDFVIRAGYVAEVREGPEFNK